jgi:molybdenum cofactor guanylyltransferase
MPFEMVIRVNVEAVLLTGGASSRMGRDKAKLLIEGEPLGERIARLLAQSGLRVTVCGREPLGEHPFILDDQEFAGPLAALSRFKPICEFVFVASCDLPGFDPLVVDVLLSQIGDHDAALPVSEGRMQPLCGLYRERSFDLVKKLVAGGERRLMRWIERLDPAIVTDLETTWVANVNTIDDLRRFDEN